MSTAFYQKVLLLSSLIPCIRNFLCYFRFIQGIISKNNDSVYSYSRRLHFNRVSVFIAMYQHLSFKVNRVHCLFISVTHTTSWKRRGNEIDVLVFANVVECLARYIRLPASYIHSAGWLTCYSDCCALVIGPCVVYRHGEWVTHRSYESGLSSADTV